jgi:N-hydroxyarylamine O-acetyltransferase
MLMEIQAYLDRIDYHGKTEANPDVLKRIHEQHVLRVPFENLDIHYGKAIVLEETRIYAKVVENHRGGFCYELNLLFHWLLTQLGFTSKIIAARIINSEGQLGPAFDHMCLLVELPQIWLVDVGFGDLFRRPVLVEANEIQTDGRNYFKVESYAPEEYLLLMSSDKIRFSRKYTFTTQARSASDFAVQCEDKQTNPDSHFVKNRICTRPTPEGRITVYNQKLIHKIGEQTYESIIGEEPEFSEVLKEWFDIVIK